MHDNKKTEVLEDLLKINKDCSSSLEALMVEQPALSPLIQKIVNVERDCLLELRKQVDITFGDPADAVERSGEIYHVWEERSHKDAAKDNELCALCEKKVKDLMVAYNKAIQKSSELSDHVTRMLQQQVDRVRDAFTILVKRTHDVNDGRRIAIPE